MVSSTTNYISIHDMQMMTGENNSKVYLTMKLIRKIIILMEQNEFSDLIDDITDHVDRTDQRLISETRHIKIVDRKSNTCCKYYYLIYFLHECLCFCGKINFSQVHSANYSSYCDD